MLVAPTGKVGNLTVGYMLTDFMCEEEIFTEEREGSWFVEGIFLQGDVLNNNKRVYPTTILDTSVDQYTQSRINGKTAWGELGHPDCNVLTDKELQDFYILTSNRGWKSFDSLVSTDRVLTYNVENEILESKEINKIVKDLYDGECYHLKGRGVDIIVTPNHRWICKDKYGKIRYVTSEEIYQNRISSGKKYEKYKILKTGTTWVGKDPEWIEISGISSDEYDKHYWLYKEDVSDPLLIPTDVFVKFLGIWLAEGFVVKANRREVGITQNDGEKADTIRALLKRFPLDWYEVKNGKKITFRISDIRLGRYLAVLGDCYTKYIPYEIKQLSPHLLEELIYWFNLGDGRFDESSGYMKRNIFSTSKRLIEDLHECLIKSGGSGNWQEFICEEDYVFADHLIKAENKKPLYQLTLSTTSGIYLDQRFLKIEKIVKRGYACCLRVQDNQNFYMKYKGKSYWTGNSPKINLDKAAILTSQLVKKGKDFYGKAKVCHEDCPMGKILRGLLKTGGRVGVSSRGLGTADKGKWQEEDCDLVDHFVLRAIDVVADPSAPDAMVNSIQEEKMYILDDSSGEVMELNEESYKMFESQLRVMPVKKTDKTKKVYDAMKIFLNSLRANTK